jgi:hypothetical protein
VTTVSEPQLSPEQTTDVIMSMIETLTPGQCCWVLNWLASDGREVQRTLVTAIALAREHAA